MQPISACFLVSCYCKSEFFASVAEPAFNCTFATFHEQSNIPDAHFIKVEICKRLSLSLGKLVKSVANYLFGFPAIHFLTRQALAVICLQCFYKLKFTSVRINSNRHCHKFFVLAVCGVNIVTEYSISPRQKT